MKVQIWSDEFAKKELKKRLNYAIEARKVYDLQWKKNESTIFGNTLQVFDSVAGLSFLDDLDDSELEVNVSYAFKNFRLIHAQMSANPPSVAISPSSTDQDDRRKAEAASILTKYALRTYDLTEKVDLVSLNTLLYGIGYVKTVWNPFEGEIIDSNTETGEVTLEGDVEFSVPNVYFVYPDPDVQSFKDCRYVFEKRVIPFEDAMNLWPGYTADLKRARIQNESQSEDQDASELKKKSYYDSVEIFEYWETGLPVNGYLGRFCTCLRDGTVLGNVKPSSFRFAAPGRVAEIDNRDIPDEVKEARKKKLPKKARLPYSSMTDIDVPNSLFGKSSVEYAAPIQGLVNSLDALKMQNIQAHGVTRMILPEAAEITDDSISDTPMDIIRITGNQPPYFQSPPQTMQDHTEMRGNLAVGVNDMMGTNEAMFGQQSREQSGASMQIATNQGNMVRRRLFNKYRNMVEKLYKDYLDVIREKWDVERTVKAVGKEKIVYAVDIKGADIDGGFDINVEYGTNFSLDPTTRREEILSLYPIFEKAGLPATTLLQHLKLNEIEGLFDSMKLPENRQREIFEKIIATGEQSEPRRHDNHELMLIYAKDWVMSSEFNNLPEETKSLIEDHIDMRAQAAAQQAAAAQPQPGQPAGGQPGATPEQPGMEQADLEEIQNFLQS